MDITKFLFCGAALLGIGFAVKRFLEDRQHRNNEQKDDVADKLIANRLVVDELTLEDLRSWGQANSSANIAVRHVIAKPSKTIMQLIGCQKELKLDPSHSVIQLVLPHNERDVSALRFRLIQFNRIQHQPLQTRLQNDKDGMAVLEFAD